MLRSGAEWNFWEWLGADHRQNAPERGAELMSYKMTRWLGAEQKQPLRTPERSGLHFLYLKTSKMVIQWFYSREIFHKVLRSDSERSEAERNFWKWPEVEYNQNSPEQGWEEFFASNRSDLYLWPRVIKNLNHFTTNFKWLSVKSLSANAVSATWLLGRNCRVSAWGRGAIILPLLPNFNECLLHRRDCWSLGHMSQGKIRNWDSETGTTNKLYKITSGVHPNYPPPLHPDLMYLEILEPDKNQSENKVIQLKLKAIFSWKVWRTLHFLHVLYK